MPGATLPTNWLTNHAPTAAEAAQVLSAITRITNISVLRMVPGSPATTGSATYVNLGTGTSLAYTKDGAAAASNLLVFIAATAYRTVTNNSAITIGVNIGGVDTDVAFYTFNALSDHRPVIGFNTITGLAAGAYTVQARVKTVSGTFNFDTGDQLCMLVAELPL